MKLRRVQANKGMQPKRAKGQHWATRSGMFASAPASSPSQICSSLSAILPPCFLNPMWMLKLSPSSCHMFLMLWKTMDCWLTACQNDLVDWANNVVLERLFCNPLSKPSTSGQIFSCLGCFAPPRQKARKSMSKVAPLMNNHFVPKLQNWRCWTHWP